MAVKIIAEIAQAHDGSLGIAHSYIDVLAEAGVDVVKFQTHIAEAESSCYEPFRVKFSYEDDTRYDYWHRMEFTKEQWRGLKDHCEQKGVEFMSSPFSLAAVDLLEELGVKAYKIGSGETCNLLMLEKILSTKKSIILSSGMNSIDELDKAILFMKEKNPLVDLSLLQCTTAYPTAPKDWGLNMIPFLKERYRLKTGFSDHSGDIYACLAAVALGVEIIEFHAVFDKQMFGPDAKASMTIDQIKSLVKGVRQIEDSFQADYKKDTERFASLKGMFEKSLCVNKDLKAGSVLSQQDLETKKPKGYGIDASQYESIIGKTLKHDMKKWDFLTTECINQK